MKYRVYGFDECPFCAAAIDELLFSDAELEVVKLPTKEERVLFMDLRGFVAPNRTFPRIYEVRGEEEIQIGSYDDLLLINHTR